MDSRKQFEEWYAEESKGWPPAITVCCKETMWGTWQASRAAIVIELPEDYPFNKEPKYESDRKQTIRECREAVHSQGIRTK